MNLHKFYCQKVNKYNFITLINKIKLLKSRKKNNRIYRSKFSEVLYTTEIKMKKKRKKIEYRLYIYNKNI